MDDHTEDVTTSSGEDNPRLKRRLGARVFQPEELRFVDYFVDRPGSQDGPPHRRPQDVQRELRQLRTRDRTPRPSGHQPLPRPPSQFVETFNAEALKGLEKSLNRGRRKGGLGKYAKVLSKAGELYGAGRGEQLGAAQALVSVIEGYLKKKRMDAYAEEKAKGDAGDKITIRKVEEAQRMLLEAKRMIEDHVDRGFPGRDSDDPRARQRACEGHAITMGRNFGMRKAGGGTSDVLLFGNSGGKVSYAFKSVNGESVQTGMPKGSGAMREAMSGAMSAFFKQGGLDFGFPEVHIAKLPVDEDRTEVGALIEGISGDMADPEEIDKIYQADAENKGKWFNEETEKNRALSRQVPPADLHKVLLSNLAMANFDIKWGNIIAVDGSDGQKHARPFDGGTAFPGSDALKALEEGFGVIPGQALLYEAVSPTRNMQELPAADMPLDPALVKQFLAIDTAAMWKVMQAERERYCREFGFDAKLLDDASLMISVKSITEIQGILKATPGITMRDFVDAYSQIFKTKVLG